MYFFLEDFYVLMHIHGGLDIFFSFKEWLNIYIIMNEGPYLWKLQKI